MNLSKFSKRVCMISLKVVVVVCLIMVLYKGASSAYYYGYSVFNDAAMEEEPGTNVSVTITKDATKKEIGNVLVEKGLIENATVFWIQTLMVEKGDEMKPGRYELNTSMTAYEMISVMAAEEEESDE